MTKQQGKQVAAMVFALSALVFGVWITRDVDSSSLANSRAQEVSTAREYSNAEAYAMAETIISPYLKAPSTAKFPNMSEVKISRLEDDGFRVDGYVDSQNSFGAMLRSPFITIFQYSNSSDKADIYAVVLDGETLLKRTPNGQ